MADYRIIFMVFLLFPFSFKGSADKTDNLQKPSMVEIRKTENQYKLFVNDEEFYIKGAGCEFGNIPALAENGANSFRTWRTNNGKKILDLALEHNLMVTMGLDVAKERHGFDYNDEEAVKKQLEDIRKQVLELKDHPALLIWAIGNELNLRAKNPKVWNAVNEIAKMIKSIDPFHPVTTTLAGVSKVDVKYILERCPDIDLMSFQLYGEIVNLQKYIDKAGWEGPYMVTEWGPTGHWEVDRTSWGRPIEETSTEKKESYISRYRIAIESDPENCLGSYAFLWGQKQERTPTWYGMFLETGEETASVDAMYYLWNGKWPENTAPDIEPLLINNKKATDNVSLKPGLIYQAKTLAKDKEDDPLTIKWEIRKEVTKLSDGGDFEPSEPPIPGLIINQNGMEIDFKAPQKEGQYRLFVYVIDSKDKAATANIPFQVKN